MRARLLVFVLVSAGLPAGNERAHAQSAPGDAQSLPPIVVSPSAVKPKPRVARTTPRTQRVARPVPAPRVAAAPAASPSPSPSLYPNTPIPGSGIDPDKVPAFVNTVDANQIELEHSANIANALEKFVPGVVVNEVAGNPFQPNVQFRGFVASPVSGTPQ
jgi:hypothetical protein